MNDVKAVRELFEKQAEDVSREADEVVEVVADVVEDEVVEETVDVVEATDAVEATETVDEDAYTVDSLAEAIGWEASQLYDIDIGMGDHGAPVKLGELKDKYQSVVSERDGLAKRIEEQEGQLSAAQEVSQAGAGMSKEVMDATVKIGQINAQYNSTDWADLEEKDPGQAALLRQKFQQAHTEAQSALAVSQQNMQSLQQQNLQKAHAVMLEGIPEWKDDTTRMNDQGKMRPLMKRYGYSDAEINVMSDARGMQVFRDLMLLTAEKTAGQAAAKVVRGKPKVLKGGSRFKKEDKNTEAARLKKAVENASPGQRKKAELNAVKALLIANK